MGLTAIERERLARIWRDLAEGCLAGHVGGAWSDAVNWVSPLDDASDSYVLFALARLAKSVVKAKRTDGHHARRPALTALALLALDLLPGSTPPPQLPFRADLDG